MGMLNGATALWAFRSSENSGTASGYAASIGFPYWVKLVRSGNTFTSYIAADGSTWVPIFQQTIVMAGTIYVGLASSSDSSAFTTASFDNVYLAPAPGMSSPSPPLGP